MKQTNFSLADVLTILTALAFGFVCFLGENFITMGDTRQSIFLASIITLLLVATALGAKLLKRTKGNFKICFIWEIVMLILFTGFIFYFSYTSFFHYFVVAERKQDIQNNLAASITQAKNMFADYESYAQNRETQYKQKLDRVIIENNNGTNQQGYVDCGFVTDGLDATLIQQKVKTLRADLFPTNYSDSTKTGVKDVATAWLSNAKAKINGWKPIGIVSVANEVEQYSNKWLNILVTLSKIREKCEQAQDFPYNLSFNDVKKHFTNREKPTVLSIGLAVVAYLLMLLSYLITKRSTKSSLRLSNHKGEFDIEY